MNSDNETIYPDILIRHNFMESSIKDDELFEIAAKAVNEYGSSRIIFAGIENEEDKNKIKEIADLLFSKQDKSLPEIVNRICDDLMLSETMKRGFFQLMSYYMEIDGNIDDLIQPFYDEYPLPVRNKVEGKKIYELIRNRILG